MVAPENVTSMIADVAANSGMSAGRIIEAYIVNAAPLFELQANVCALTPPSEQPFQYRLRPPWAMDADAPKTMSAAARVTIFFMRFLRLGSNGGREGCGAAPAYWQSSSRKTATLLPEGGRLLNPCSLAVQALHGAPGAVLRGGRAGAVQRAVVERHHVADRRAEAVQGHAG